MPVSVRARYTNAAFYLASVITAINAVAVALGGLGVTDAAATDFENVNYTELLLNEDARSQFVASFTNPVTWCNLATICIGVLIVVCQKRSKILEKKLKAWNAAVATSHEVTAEFRTYLSVVNFTSSKAVNAELDTAELKKATKAALSRFMNEEFQRHRLKVADMLNKAMDESARLVRIQPHVWKASWLFHRSDCARSLACRVHAHEGSQDARILPRPRQPAGSGSPIVGVHWLRTMRQATKLCIARTNAQANACVNE